MFVPSNLGWLYYGMLKTDQTLIVVNLIGALLQALYIVVYFKYTKQKVMVTSAGVYFMLFLPPGDIQLNQLGLVCSMATVGVYMSPLADLIRMHSLFFAMRKKNASLSFDNTDAICFQYMFNIAIINMQHPYRIVHDFPRSCCPPLNIAEL
uniref:Sugar transporter SWEET1 n=1 Tax=Hippocampus comes TaxID=109280 RepID=A0A3Q2XR66_HIPCM